MEYSDEYSESEIYPIHHSKNQKKNQQKQKPVVKVIKARWVNPDLEERQAQAMEQEKLNKFYDLLNQQDIKGIRRYLKRNPELHSLDTRILNEDYPIDQHKFVKRNGVMTFIQVKDYFPNSVSESEVNQQDCEAPRVQLTDTWKSETYVPITGSTNPQSGFSGSETNKNWQALQARIEVLERQMNFAGQVIDMLLPKFPDINRFVDRYLQSLGP